MIQNYDFITVKTHTDPQFISKYRSVTNPDYPGWIWIKMDNYFIQSSSLGLVLVHELYAQSGFSLLPKILAPDLKNKLTVRLPTFWFVISFFLILNYFHKDVLKLWHMPFLFTLYPQKCQSKVNKKPWTLSFKLDPVSANMIRRS